MIKVLVCDDDKIIIEKVQQLLTIIQEQYSFELDIKTYNDGLLAMESKETYDIAIVDIEMPNVDGLALSEKLKRRNPDTIVLILTSFSDYLDSAMRIQVFRYLSKPIDEERFTKNFIEAVSYYKQISKQIIVESGDEVLTIKTKDIFYIEEENLVEEFLDGLEAPHTTVCVAPTEKFVLVINVGYTFCFLSITIPTSPDSIDGSLAIDTSNFLNRKPIN